MLEMSFKSEMKFDQKFLIPRVKLISLSLSPLVMLANCRSICENEIMNKFSAL